MSLCKYSFASFAWRLTPRDFWIRVRFYFYSGFFLWGKTRGHCVKVGGEKYWFCLHRFDCLKWIWMYSETALNKVVFGASSICRVFANQSWQQSRHWNTWHFSSSLLRKHYIFWKVKCFIKMLCSGYKYRLGSRLGASLAVAGSAERLPVLVSWQLLRHKVWRHQLAGLLERASLTRARSQGSRWGCLSLFMGPEWIKMPEFLCVESMQGNGILGDPHHSRWWTVGDPVAFALPRIRCSQLLWRMSSVQSQAHILSLSRPSLQGIIRHSTYKSFKSSEVFSSECSKKFT